jgi:nucleotide-binding universal stress UspA family protein
MYRHLLVPLENSKADDFVLEHVQKLAHDGHAKISLIHVAHGHVARNQKQLNLAPSEEMQAGRQYVAAQRKALVDSGFDVTAHFASGEPSDEILAYAAKIHCDLIVMATHGHRFLADLVLGSVSDEVRHRTDIPVLLLRCPQPKHQRQHR